MSRGLLHSYASWRLRGQLGQTIRRLGSVAARHPRTALVGAILLVLLVLWVRTYAGRAIVLPFVAGSGWEASHGQRPESELSAALAGWQERELLVRRHLFAPLGRFEFAFEELARGDRGAKSVCRWLLEEPGLGTYDSALFRVTDEALGTRGLLPVRGPGELKTPFGTVPLEALNRALLTLLPVASQVYSGSAILQGDSLEVQVRREKPEPASWRASGPVSARAEIFEYLALSLRFPFARGRDLAFSLGVEALETGRLRRAADFLEIARNLSPADREVEVLLGLTLYALSAESGGPAGGDGDPRHGPGEEPPGADGRNDAIRALERAVRAPGPGPGEALSPYLGCLLLVSGREDEVVFLVEESRYEAWRELLADPAGILERTRLLAHYPLPGPRRHLTEAQGEVLMVAGEGRLVRVRPGAQPELVGSPGLQPRQILALPRRGSEDTPVRPLILWGDGSLTENHDRHEEPTYSDFLKVLGATHQMVRTQAGDKLFFLNRYGEVFAWEPYDSEPTPLPIDGPPPIHPLRQILVWGEKLYLLADDGSVWGAAVGGGRASRLTAPAPVQEMVVGGSRNGRSVLFLLHQNGNVWAYRDPKEPGEPDLFDNGINTRQIFATDRYLYVLKQDGRIWRREIVQGRWFPIFRSDGLRFREILVVRAGEGSRRVYLKSIDDELYRGLDRDDLPEDGMSVRPIFPRQ